MACLCAEASGLRGPKRFPIPHGALAALGRGSQCRAARLPSDLGACTAAEVEGTGGMGRVGRLHFPGTLCRDLQPPLLVSISPLVCPLYETQGHLQLFRLLIYFSFFSIGEHTTPGHGLTVLSNPAAPCLAQSVQRVLTEWKERVRYWANF